MRIIKVTEKVSLARDVDTGNETQQASVDNILAQVREEGDQALKKLTEQFDGAALENLLVTKEEMGDAYNEVDDEVLEALRQAALNIREFHERQTRQSGW